MENTTSGTLIDKLDEFIRKYYKNRILRGVIYSVAMILAAYLLVVALEYFGKFNTGVRTFLFWSFVVLCSYVLIRLVFIPLFKLFRLGEVISHKQASMIVGNHFPEIKDKLLNTLQLQEMAGGAPAGSLLYASIEQKTEELRPIPFTAAVDFSENKKYLKYAVPPVVIFMLLLVLAPPFLKDSTSRLINHTTDIVPVAPYQIRLLNELEVAEKEDFELMVELSGAAIPNQVYVEQNGTRFKLEALGKTRFKYDFRNVQKDLTFRLYADGFYSEPYTLKTLPKPMLVNFTAQLDYPKYVGLTDEQVRNSGDLTVPVGTKINWVFETRHTEQLEVRVADTLLALANQSENIYTHQLVAMRPTDYSLHASNRYLKNPDSVMYRISVIPDQYPSVIVNEERDSLSQMDLFFTGEVQDDYGFQRLNFSYAFTESEDKSREIGLRKTIPLQVPNSTAGQFFYHWKLGDLGLLPGDKINYYFEVWDNDQVHGSKSSRTMERVYAAPTLDEVKEIRDEQNEDIKDKLQKSIDDAKDLQDKLEELRKDLLNKEELGWQEKKKVEEILEQQKELQKQVDELKKENEKKDFQESQFNERNEEIRQKQEKLQELFDELMNDEMREMYEEMERMMEELNKDELQEQIEQMDLNSEDLEKELDRALEQFKQMEWEMKMEDSIEKLKELSEKQEELSEKSAEKDADEEKLKEEQDKLNEEFDKLQEELDEIEKMNEELENPNNMPETEEQQEEIDQEMQKSSEQLGEKKKKKASDSQKNASEKMEQMAQQMEQAMQQNSEESMEEDLDALRALLENVITLSFDQEQLMANISSVDKNDPKYIQYGQTQRKLKDDAKMVEDSLFALSKRIIQLQAAVNREIGLVNNHMEKALEEIAERRTNEVTTNQQYVMTSFNNLALLLDEALKAMQQQLSCQKPGTGNCEKPGGSGSPKPSAGDMKKMQQALSDQLKKMKEQMGEGNKGKNKGGQGGMSKEIAQMAAKQAAIRQMMQQMGQQLNEDGSGNGNELKQIAKEMEQIEEDLVNKRVTDETLKRQQDIMIRLLKAENAERTRDQDEQRKSKAGDQQLRSNPIQYSEYQKKKQREVEMLKTVPPSLKPYYREKVNDYFNNLDR